MTREVRKTGAKAIAFTEFDKGRFKNRPPQQQAGLLDNLAEAVLSVTGLKKQARARLNSSLLEAQSEFYIQRLHTMCNEVVDGGVRGLAVALKVCFCLKK